MPGSFAVNAKEGSRSEVLADYLFSRWGPVTPVRRTDDYGIDLYCTLFDRIGQGAAVRDYFSVQVKSGLLPWEFTTYEQVQWLTEYPTPLFFACVDKKKLSVSIYHVGVRFLLRAMGTLGGVVLVPEDGDTADSLGGITGQIGRYSLLAPVLKVTVEDIMDDTRMEQLRCVFETWVRFERDNCDLARRGLLRFRIPIPYRVNEIPASSIYEMGNVAPPDDFLLRGILTLAEDAECLGGQFYQRGDRAGSLYALILVYHLRKKYPSVFNENPRWRGHLPADIGRVVNRALNNAAGHPTDTSGFHGLDELMKVLQEDPTVKRFLEGEYRGLASHFPMT